MPTSTFSAKKFKQLVNARPFRPFSVTLFNGKSFVVPRPDAALVTQYFIRIGIDFTKDEIARRCVNCPIFHLTNVEIVKPEKSAKASKRKR
jgi:hypothetical protein